MSVAELDAFSDFVVVTSFVQTGMVSLQLSLPHLRKGQIYVAKIKALEAELCLTKTNVDLGDFAIPIDNLLGEGIPNRALAVLNEFIVEQTSTGLGSLYQDVNEDCLSHIKCQCHEQTTAVAGVSEVPFQETKSLSNPYNVKARGQKAKSRPAHSSCYSIISIPATVGPEIIQTARILKVKPATLQDFSTLFAWKESRGSISWTSFEATMADFGLSVTPNMGSVITFCPLENVPFERPITLHRPHQAHLEGYQLLFIAKRLKRAFGLGHESFEVV
ncbi:hypothetical protein BJX64DRAFT_49786 [Aspergillus heterothallicus]